MVATLAEATGISIEDVFNGLLLAIPALTALTALAALGGLPPLRRVVAASLVGMPFLAASFFAQSSFKETALALFVLGFALSLAALSREGPDGQGRTPGPRGRRRYRPARGRLGAHLLRARALPGSASAAPSGSSSS